MKKLSFLFVCLISVLNISAEVYSGSCGENASYSLDTETGVLSITGSGPMYEFIYGSSPWLGHSDNIKNVVIENGITTIGMQAFTGCAEISSVTIPKSIVSIGEDAFINCTSLKSINLPNGVKSIGRCAFQGCKSVTSVTIPSSVNSISEYAFYECAGDATIYCEIKNGYFQDSHFSSVIVGDGVTTIGYGSFWGCKATSITLPNSVTTIEPWAFYVCDHLESINIPQNVSFIGEYAFSNCYNLKSPITIPNKTATIERCAFQYCEGLTSITIENGVRTIGSGAFSSCQSLESIVVPNSVNRIETGAFGACKKLKSIDIPTSVYYVGTGAVEMTPWYDSKPDGVMVYVGSAAYKYKGMPTDEKDSTVVIKSGTKSISPGAFEKSGWLKHISLPEGLLEIGECAFYNCINLTSVTIPDGVTTIERDAFNECWSLNSITVPNSVTSIEYRAFDNTPWLGRQPEGMLYTGLVAYKYIGSMPENTSITLKEGTTCIAGNAFRECYSLTSLTIPSSVINMGTGIFDYCSNLKTVNIWAKNPPISFSGAGSSDATLHVPFGCKSKYEEADYWGGSYRNIVDDLMYFLRGDANGDGEIGMPDVMFVVNYILGNPAETFNADAADANLDGEIGMPDVMFIVNYILNGKFPNE